jgi:hypothetical protein
METHLMEMPIPKDRYISPEAISKNNAIYFPIPICHSHSHRNITSNILQEIFPEIVSIRKLCIAIANQAGLSPELSYRN